MLHANSLGRFLMPFLLVAGGAVQAEDGPPRFPLLNDSQMTPAQRELAHNIRSGPRASVAGSAANASASSLGSPFNVFLRSPELGEHLQRAQVAHQMEEMDDLLGRQARGRLVEDDRGGLVQHRARDLDHGAGPL